MSRWVGAVRPSADGDGAGAGAVVETAAVTVESAATEGRTDAEDKGDIPSPVLTGQVQRVWISAGTLLGTPCQSPSLAACRPSGTAFHFATRTLGLPAERLPWHSGTLKTRRAGAAVAAPARQHHVSTDGIRSAYSSDAGTPTPRMIGSLAGFRAAALTASGALASCECPVAAAGAVSWCSTDVSLAAPWARLALRFRRGRRVRVWTAEWSAKRSASPSAAGAGRVTAGAGAGSAAGACTAAGACAAVVSFPAGAAGSPR